MLTVLVDLDMNVVFVFVGQGEGLLTEIDEF